MRFRRRLRRRKRRLLKVFIELGKNLRLSENYIKLFNLVVDNEAECLVELNKRKRVNHESRRIPLHLIQPILSLENICV